MFHQYRVKVFTLNFLTLLSILPEYYDCLIITSVLAGDKKFKTVSFHSKLIKPLMFEKEMPLTEFRRHTTMRAPKFDIDINIPIKLPVEDEYYKEAPSKPVESTFSLQTGEIYEPNYPVKSKVPKKGYSQQHEPIYAASTVGIHNQRKQVPEPKVYNTQDHQIHGRQHQPDVLTNRQSEDFDSRARQAHGGPDVQENLSNLQQQQASEANTSPKQMDQYDQAQGDPGHNREVAQESAVQETSYLEQPSPKNYDTSYRGHNNYQQEFVPGGYVNLQLSGPSGGPKLTHEDYDREKWAQQLSQAPGAMPYPILNYQQLQNFYGGLGTFTNGLPENRYETSSVLEKLKTGLSHLTNKFSRSSSSQNH